MDFFFLDSSSLGSPSDSTFSSTSSDTDLSSTAFSVSLDSDFIELLDNFAVVNFNLFISIECKSLESVNLHLNL